VAVERFPERLCKAKNAFVACGIISNTKYSESSSTVAWRKTVAAPTIGRITVLPWRQTAPDPTQEIRRPWDIRDPMQFDDEKNLDQLVLNRASAIPKSSPRRESTISNPSSLHGCRATNSVISATG
jgi:hypothetical protein